MLLLYVHRDHNEQGLFGTPRMSHSSRVLLIALDKVKEDGKGWEGGEGGFGASDERMAMGDGVG